MANVDADIQAELSKAREDMARQQEALWEEMDKAREELRSGFREIRTLLYIFLVLLLITNPKLVELLGRALGIIK